MIHCHWIQEKVKKKESPWPNWERERAIAEIIFFVILSLNVAVDVVVWRVRDSFYPCLGDDIVLIQEEGLRGQQSSLSFSSLEGKTCRFMVASLSPPYIHQTNFSPSYIPTSNTSSASQHHHKPLSPSPTYGNDFPFMEATSSLKCIGKGVAVRCSIS